MVEELTVRPAEPRDYEAICTLAAELDDMHRQHLPDRFRRPDGPVRAREYIHGLIQDDDSYLAVAELAGEVVGVINAGLDRTPDVPVKRPRRFVKVRGVVVRSAARRRGVCRALLAAVESWTLRRGAVEVQLSVYDFNADARSCYEALGFVPLSHRLVRRLDGGRPTARSPR